MSRLARPVAITMALATGLLLLAAFVLWARSGFATPPYVFMRGWIGMFAFILAGVAQLTSGLVIALRRPDLSIGPLGLLFAFILSTATVANAYLALAASGVSVPWDPRWVAWAPSCLAFAGATLTAQWLGLIFPDGRLHRPYGGAALAVIATGAILTAVAMGFQPGFLILYPGIPSPLAVDPSLGGPLLATAIFGLGLLGLGGVAVSVVLVGRYRSADRIVRAQLRWYIATAILLVAGFLAFLGVLASLPNGSPLGEAVLVAFVISAALPPVAIVVAITRYHLFEIDTILSRTFVFGALTAILAGVYTASIRLFNLLFTTVTGEASEAALVITTLVIAASFTPLKRRLEGVVERRFTGLQAPSGESGSASAAEASTFSPSGAGSGPVGVDEATLRRLVAAVLADPTMAAALEARSASATAGPESADPPAPETAS
ncbi:MAG TPA: hypothetical protein VLS28_01960 [Candidatus Sulfomarinibacteraceae bacterium]|nr:hypothetical protein [Candidatus Sulfomarinibacteraceae bacterium]